MSDSHPRVLIVNLDAFGHHSATASTLSNLFRGWPADRLALAHLDPCAADPGGGICSRVWTLTLEDVPVYRTVRKLLGGQKDRLVGRATPGMPAGLGTPGAGEAAPMRARIHGVANAWSDLLPLRPPPAFWKWVDEFQPEVIYSILGTNRWMNLVLKIAGRHGIPIVPHFMDDWPMTLYRGVFKIVPRSVLRRRLRAVLRNVPVGLGIGPAMVEEYRRRYGIPFEAFMNCVEVPEMCLAEPERGASRPLRFVFSGGLHLSRWHELVEVGKALATLQAEGANVELVVHAPSQETARYGQALSAIPSIRLGESLSPDQLMPALREADVLVHVDSFDQMPRKYLRFSMSTKLPLYMSFGKPILIYGPGELASSRHIQDCECGIVVGEQDSGLLLEAVRSLATDPQRRALLGRRGWLAAGDRHSGDKVRPRFRAVLTRAASAPREAKLSTLGQRQ